MREGGRSHRGGLHAGLISAPQNDLRHTLHVGYDGAVFGDVSFIALPPQTETAGMMLWQGPYRPWKVPEISVEISRPGKSRTRHRSWKTQEESWNSKVVLEIILSGSSVAPRRRNLFVIHCVHFVTSWVNSDFRNTFILLSKLFWYVHFFCNHVCECSVYWKVLENSVLARDSMLSALYAIANVRHTGGSVENGWS